MVHALWDSLTRHRVRTFGPPNVVSLITSVVICIIQTINVMNDPRPFGFHDIALLVAAISISAAAIEPAFPPEHAAARALRVTWFVSVIVALAGAIWATVSLARG